MGFYHLQPKWHIGKFSHPDSWPGPQLDELSCLVGWLVLFCFASYHPFVLSVLKDASESQPTICSTQVFRIFWERHFWWPRVHHDIALPCCSHVLTFSLGENFHVSWLGAPPHSLPQYPLLSACLLFLAGDGTKLNNDAPSSTQNCELPLPLRILISFLFSPSPSVSIRCKPLDNWKLSPLLKPALRLHLKHLTSIPIDF